MKMSDPGMLFSRRALFSLAVPMILNSLFAIVTGFIDTIMVSHAGEAAVSGVSLVNSVATLLMLLFTCLSTGGSVVCAHAIGAENYPEARASANQLFYSITAISLAVGLFLFVFNAPLLHLIYPTVDGEIFSAAKDYLFWIALSMPFASAGGVGTILTVARRTKAVLFVSTLTNIINILGNALLIYVFEMGAAGAAIATLISRVATTIIYIYIGHDRSNKVYLENLMKVSFRWDIQKKIFSVGLPFTLERVSISFGELMIASLIASFGSTDIGANAVVRTICNFGWVATGCFGGVILTVVGQCFGAKQTEQVSFYTKKILTASTTFSFIVFALIAIFHKPLLSLFNLTSETMVFAEKLLLFTCLLTFVGGYALSYVPLSAFRAAGDTKYPLFMTLVTMLFFRVGGSFLLGGALGLGIFGVYIAEGSDWLFRAVCNITKLIRGKWKNYKSAEETV